MSFYRAARLSFLVFALINKLMDRSKNGFLSSFQFVDLASIAFALVTSNSH
ncbi:hypothetical protein LEP1GSC060_0791 [Leptospira weilii serovar Ranarum str. ICFT]|uniref:Uncharacterized protein n=1 Tax=Leptospira weilii serovar Ranarum str. ICFT TaxID=1218598 RepID=N1WT31_9LEPT|nr:hypothetical protein LEP1GSC060_0791 [Leptospira weilii serovar Ranarum str. ICFT]